MRNKAVLSTSIAVLICCILVVFIIDGCTIYTCHEKNLESTANEQLLKRGALNLLLVDIKEISQSRTYLFTCDDNTFGAVIFVKSCFYHLWRLDTVFYSKENPNGRSEISYVPRDQLKQYPITLVLDKSKGNHIKIGRIKHALPGRIASLLFLFIVMAAARSFIKGKSERKSV